MEPAPGDDVPDVPDAGPLQPAPGSDVTGNEVTVQAGAGLTPVTATVTMATSMATGSALSTSGVPGLGMAGFVPQMQFPQQQQQWMMPMGYQPYGNFVPNFAFGEVPQHAWDEPDPGAEACRQLNHEISDEDSSQGEEQEPQLVPVGRELIVDLDPATLEGDGKAVELLKEQLSQVKEADKVSSKVGEGTEALLEKYLRDAQGGADLDKVIKNQPRVDNVPRMKVPRLDTEVYQVLDQKVRNQDQGFQGIQRALLAALAAMAPLVDLVLKRNSQDPELDGLAQNLFDTLLQVSFAHNTISSKRRERLRPLLAPVYAKALTKGHDQSPEWLFGGDLLTTTRKCEAAKRLGEKVLKRRQQQQQPRQQGPQQKRFKNPKQQQGQGNFRAQNMYQQPRFPAPQSFQQYVPYSMQYQVPMANYQRQGNPRAQQQKGQGFQKRGGYQK